VPELPQARRICLNVNAERFSLQHRTERAEDILGPIDALKFQSCLTVFEAAAAGGDDRSLFADGLKAFFDDGRDARTLAMLKADQRDGKPDVAGHQ
jgi:uncharacterized protein (DUF1810 family)